MAEKEHTVRKEVKQTFPKPLTEDDSSKEDVGKVLPFDEDPTSHRYEFTDPVTGAPYDEKK